MGADKDLNAIVAKLEEDIVLWQIPPGTRLVEDQLMERFATKRHIVRSALERLSLMGLVDRIPNRGSVVKSYELTQVARLFEYRKIIEPAAANLIPMPVSEHALDELRFVQKQHDDAGQRGDMAGLFRANHAFHRAIFSLCPNEYLSGSIEHAAMQAHAVRFSSVQDQDAVKRAREDHHNMIRAIAEGDRAELVTLCRTHLQLSYDAYVRFARRTQDGSV